MISDYEDELAKLTDNPDGLAKEEEDIDEQMETLQKALRAMEGKINFDHERAARSLREYTAAWSRATMRSSNLSAVSNC